MSAPTASSPTGAWVRKGMCGQRGCDDTAVYEVRHSNWPAGMRTGVCAEHAPAARLHLFLSTIRTWRGDR